MRLSASIPIAHATRVGVSIPTRQPTAPTVWAGRRIGGVWLTASTVLQLLPTRGHQRNCCRSPLCTERH
jgi:hypothetical protein